MTEHPRETSSDREFDLVLVGATGFVGRLTAAHLAENGGGVRIALAGRDRSRLEKARAALPAAAAAWELVEVDVTKAEQAVALARRTRVVCSTVGPYDEYGKELVRACAKEGSHYCDLTGELPFVRWSIDTVADLAESSGARIVHSCGFDSVPSELGVLETARAAAEAGDGTLTDTVTYVRSLRGGLSGGTIASMRGQFVRASEEPEIKRLLSDPNALRPDRNGSGNGTSAPRSKVRTSNSKRSRTPLSRLGVQRDEAGRWSGPFFMASYNTRVVRASNDRSGQSYGPDFRYTEVVDGGPGLKGAARSVGAAGMVTVLFGGMSTAPTRAVLDRVLPAPGEGPSEENMAKGRFVFDVEAQTTSGARYRTRVADRRDPGYTSTAVMLGQSALELASSEGPGGVHTPATGLGHALTERLRTHGFHIETEKVSD